MSVKIITGPPGSGKSKWANLASKNYKRTVCVLNEAFDFIIISKDKQLLLDSFKNIKFDHFQIENGDICN